MNGKRLKLKGAVLKCVCCFMLCAFSFQLAKAQTFAEWFSQGKTQLKYLAQQIAALTACEQGLKQGYTEAKSEWGLIGSVKNGEFLAHHGYYTSLMQVNPNIKSSPALGSVQSEQQTIIALWAGMNGLTGLSASEMAYVQNVEQNILADCAKDRDALNAVLTPGSLSLADDERLQRIARISEAVKDKYVFTCAFTNSVRLLALQRVQEGRDIQTLGRYNGND